MNRFSAPAEILPASLDDLTHVATPPGPDLPTDLLAAQETVPDLSWVEDVVRSGMVASRARYAAGRLGVDPEDLAQDVAIKLFIHAREGKLGPSSPLSTWLGITANSTAVDICRKRAVRPEEAPETEIPETGVPDRGYDDFGTREVVHGILNALTDRQRDTLTRLYLLDQSIGEVATELGISRGTVKSRSNDALRAAKRAATVNGVSKWHFPAVA